MDDKNINFSISSGTILKAIFIIGLVWILYLVRDIVLVVLTSIVLASAIEPITKWFVRYKFPRVLAVIVIYLIVFATIGGFLLLFAPTAVSEVSRFSNELPDLIESVNDVTIFPEGISKSTENIFGDISFAEVLRNLSDLLSNLQGNLFGAISFVFGGAFSFLLITVLSFYLAVQERGIENFLRVIIPLKHETYALDLWQRTKRKIGYWLQGQLVLALIIGVLVYLGLTILGIKYALILAVLAAVFELIPIFGPIIAAVPAIIFGFTQGVVPGLMVMGLYGIIQQFENHLIYPLVVTKIVGVPSLLVILSLLVGGKLAGFLGFILAVPIATLLVEVFHDLEKDKIERLKEINQPSA